MIEVIEIDPADREIAQLIKGGGARNMGEDRALSRLEGKRDEAGETAGLILQRAQLPQVIDPMLVYVSRCP